MLQIIIVEPEIPPNTGNIIRLCANTGCCLHLVKPLGFELDDAKLRRAGLDYREWASVKVHEAYEEFLQSTNPQQIYTFSKFHTRIYAEAKFRPGDALVFGSETKGLAESIRQSVDSQMQLKIPMVAGNRSLNLSNAVAIAVYEAWRQNGFQ